MDKGMEMLNEVRTSFERHRDFTGRSHRMEFWSFIGFAVLVILFTISLDDFIFGYERVVGPINIIGGLVFVVPTIAVTTRRLHDINKSGYWQVLPILTFIIYILLSIFAKIAPTLDLGVIPLVSGVALWVSLLSLIGFCAIGGDPTVNQFGDVPDIRVKEADLKPETYIYRHH